MMLLWAGLMFLVLLGGWALNLFGLPGNWLNVAAAAVYAWLVPGQHRLSISWWVVGAALVLAILGELFEFLAGAMGAAKVGGSRRGAVLAIFGSLVGGVLGATIGVPIPVIGSIVGILLFAGLGAMAGAIAGEFWKGRDWETSIKIGHAAFWGRLLGTAGKLAVGTLIVGIVLAALALK
jgi:uncharacterized protein YqgC (DUF456 family)